MTPDPNQSSLIILSLRRRGRPPNLVPSTPLTTWLPNETYDRLAHLAKHYDLSLSALVRELIDVVLDRH